MDIVKSYQSGLTILELAKRNGISEPAMRTQLIKAGAIIRKQGPKGFYPKFYKKLNPSDVPDILQSSESRRRIASRYGVSHQLISQLKRTYAVKVPSLSL